MRREEILTILYDISMQIDFTMSFDDLVSHSLSVYGKKLGSSAVSIILEKEHPEQARTEEIKEEPTVYIKPKNLLRRENYITKILENVYFPENKKNFLTYRLLADKYHEYHYFFRFKKLDGGILLITRNQMDDVVLKSLNEVNNKLETTILFIKERESIVKKDSIIQQQQSKLAELGEMMGHITHQWKQPLTTLSLLTLAAYKKMIKVGVEKSFVDSFQKDANFAINTLNQAILDFRQYITPSKKKQSFALNDVFSLAIRIVEPLVKAKKITLDQIGLESDVFLMGVSNELSHVLVNIISNAVDQLTLKDIQNANIKISLDILEMSIRIRIQDNGGGIPDEILGSIFDKYFTTKGKKGSGIGLAMARQIIEREFEGTLRAHNQSGGAVFDIIIPYSAEESNDPWWL